jgi:hypothetical protein
MLTQLKVFENWQVSRPGFSGSEQIPFSLTSGARVVIVLRVLAITGVPTVTLDVGNGESVDGPFDSVSTLTLTAAGVVRKAVSDITNQFQLTLTVSGGTADVRVTVAVMDNAIAGAGGSGGGTSDTTEATQLLVKTAVQSIDTKVATETTLAAAKADLDAINTKVATETTLAAAKVDLDSINTKVATETTLAAAKADLDAIAASVATETTLAAAKADLDAIKNSSGGSSAALSSVAGSITSVSLIIANVNRKGLTLFNDSSSVAYVAFAATASSSAYTLKMNPGGLYEMPTPLYRGELSAIWVTAAGSIKVTELT